MFYLILEPIQLSILEIREMFTPKHVNIWFKTILCIAQVNDLLYVCVCVIILAILVVCLK